MAGGEIASVTQTSARRIGLGAFVPGLTTFAAVALIGLANGGYFASSWGWAALAFALLSLLAVLARERLFLARREWLAVLSLAAFAAWTLVSVVWSASSAQPVLAFERTSVYALALLAVLLVSTTRGSAVGLTAGVLAGAVVVCGDGLTSYRGGVQLAAPVGYANGVGMLAVTGLLVALGLAANGFDRVVRAAALASMPVLAATLDLTFSRGAWLALTAGVIVALVVDARRRHLFAVLLAALPAPALLVWAIGADSTQPRLILAVAAGSILALAIGWALPSLERRLRVGRRGRRVGAIAVLGAVSFALVAALGASGGPGELAARAHRSFTRPLPASGGDLDRRLLSASSDGRVAYWRVAWQEAEQRPLLGGGAGSFARYWNLLRPTHFETQNAHNLYLETLAELGPIGLTLLLAALAFPLLGLRRARGRPATTAGAAAFAAFLAHAAIDWDFQLVAVSLAALCCGAAVLVSARPDQQGPLLRPLRRWSAAAVLAAAGLLAVFVQVGNSALAQSRTALDRDDATSAVRAALRARDWQPWSFEPWQALGDAQLAEGRVEAARASLHRALALDPTNASLWLDLAAASSGRQRSLALQRARLLDPQAGALG
jgi:tetratricopeptide (TPR) repeat protein